MKSPIYNSDRTKLLGYIVDGKFLALPPAPTGDEFDALLIDVDRVFKVHPSFNLPNGQTRRHWQVAERKLDEPIRHWLVESVTRWVTQGTLRDPQQVNEVLTAFADYRGRLVLFGVYPPDWKFDLYELKMLDTCFGVPGSKPWPSKTEIIDSREQRRREDDERRRREAESDRQLKKEIAEEQVEAEKKNRVTGLLQRMANQFYTMDDIDLTSEPLPERYHIVNEMRQGLRSFAKFHVERFINAGMSDDEIIKGVCEMIADTKNVPNFLGGMLDEDTGKRKEFRAAAPDELTAGETRTYLDTDEELKKYYDEFFASELAFTFQLSVVLCPDGRWCLTRKPKQENSEESRSCAA